MEKLEELKKELRDFKKFLNEKKENLISAQDRAEEIILSVELPKK